MTMISHDEKSVSDTPQADDKTGPDGLRWALVTGASAGIGETFCRQLAQRGWSLVLTARRLDRLQSLAAELEGRHGIRCLCLAADLAEPGAASALASEVEKHGVEVSFLVNNAGYGLPGHFTEPDWAQHEQFIQLMMTAVCELSWCFLPGMQTRGDGVIINVASLAGLVPGSAGHTLYGASKAFLIRFSESLAMENRFKGVTVCALCPGFTYSEFHDVNGTRGLVSKMPSWMWMQADEVVAFGLDFVERGKGEVIVVPGRVNRFIAWMTKSLPRRFALWMTQRHSKRFRAQETPGD